MAQEGLLTANQNKSLLIWGVSFGEYHTPIAQPRSGDVLLNLWTSEICVTCV